MFKFLIQYILHPRSVGAIAPSGKNLALKMIEQIDFDTSKIIVEYGPGTGVVSEEIIKRKKEETNLFLIEQNKEFCKILEDKYKYIKNVNIINDSVENVKSIINKYGYSKVDYIISGLPFTSLSKEMSIKIFLSTQEILSNGLFVTFQYSKVKKKFFEKYFNFVSIIKEKKNIPPAYIFVLKNKY